MPATTGGEICTAGLLNELSQQNHVTAFTVQPYQTGFEHQVGNAALIYHMPFKASRYANLLLFFKVNKLAKELGVNWIIFEQPWFAWMILLLRIFTKHKIAIRSHNIEYLRFKSLKKWFWQMLYIYEKLAYAMAHLVCFISPDDRQHAIKEFDLAESKTILVPYGVPLKMLPQHASKVDVQLLRNELQLLTNQKLILFFSTLSYMPNYVAVDDIINKLLPLLKQQTEFEYKIIICGKGLPNNIYEQLQHQPNITYMGFVKNINLYIDAADVVINPILSGGGVKTKVIDALARNQRVISTQTGAVGIDVKVCADNLIVVNDNNWIEFTQAIITTIDKPKLIPEAFYNTYSWQHISATLTQKLQQLG